MTALLSVKKLKAYVLIYIVFAIVYWQKYMYQDNSLVWNSLEFPSKCTS